MSTSPGLVLHCMRLRLLHVDEHMLLAHLTVTARVIYICCISAELRGNHAPCSYSLHLCRREFVLIPQTSQIVPHFTHQPRAKGTKPIWTNATSLFSHQAYIHLEFLTNSLLAGQQVLITGHCVRGLCSSG
jgi:hypothetical protein